MDYVVVGKFSEVNIDDIFSIKDKTIDFDRDKLKSLIIVSLGIIVTLAFQDQAHAQGMSEIIFNNESIEAAANYKAPSQLRSILEFVDWLIDLLRIIVSSVAGLICTFAGYKWATAIESNGAESAKKILKNALIGGILVWTGTTIADVFVGKMNQILL